ncbi:MAG: GntR family transcriptional regulator [Alphaproteobacteria bacterium]|nr:GntR family transcriptional regulator [Alphaproteobacteria bacterium]
MLPKSIIPRQSLQAEVVSRLRDEIIEGVWEPGARLQERRMCERYGISRSPLREAYHVLAIEGLLELLPSRGAVVTAPTKEDSMQHYTLSKALEILGLELACDNATEDELDNIEFLHRKMQRLCEKKDLPGLLKINNEIHRAIVCASGNIPLIHTHLIIARHIIRIQNLNGAIEHSTEDAFAQHEAFMAPFLKRDKAKAVSAFKKHLSTVGNNLQQRLDTAFYVD